MSVNEHVMMSAGQRSTLCDPTTHSKRWTVWEIHTHML